MLDIVKKTNDMEAQKNAFEAALGDLGLRYWEYDIPSRRLYRSRLVQNEVGYSAIKENVPESYVEDGTIHPDYAQAYLDFYHNIQKGNNDQLVFRSKYGNGTWGWLDISYKVLFDDNGVPVKAIGVGGDISRQKETEEMLERTRNEKKRIELLLETAASHDYDYISFIDGRTQEFISYSNSIPGKVRAAENYEGVLMNDIANTDIVNPKQLEQDLKWENIIENLDRDGKYSCFSEQYEESKKLRRKEYRFYYIDEKKQYVLGSVRDITETYEQTERQRQRLVEALHAANEANEAKTKFLSAMSHDIRTPMNAIIGMVELALAHEEDKKQVHESLAVIKHSSAHLLQLINDILDMSRIESGKIILAEEKFSHAAELADVVSSTNALAREKQIIFRYSTSITHDFCRGDVGVIHRILGNIIGNAVKFTGKGGTVKLEVKEIPMNNPKMALYRFEVTDTGIGMSEYTREHMFDVFYRNEDLTVRQTEGSGLGMAIVKSMIDISGGNIRIKSEPGKGSKVIVDLPLLLADSEVESDDAEKRPGTRKNYDFSGVRVLLVEDHPVNQMVATHILERTGAKIVLAENGKAAVQKFCENTGEEFEIILMDIQMPVMDGYEATRRIRASERKNAKKIPIIAMTANAFAEDIRKSKEAGMNEHLAKPVLPEKLYELISRHLS